LTPAVCSAETRWDVDGIRGVEGMYEGEFACEPYPERPYQLHHLSLAPTHEIMSGAACPTAASRIKSFNPTHASAMFCKIGPRWSLQHDLGRLCSILDELIVTREGAFGSKSWFL